MRSRQRGVIVLLIILSSPASSEDGKKMHQAAKALVAMVSGKMGGMPTDGAAVIFGRAGQRLYLVTAEHVVRKEGKTIEDPEVTFFQRKGKPAKAMLLAPCKPALDIAVLAVDVTDDALGAQLDSIDFDLLADLKTPLATDDAVIIGHGGGKPWATSAQNSLDDDWNVGDMVGFESEKICQGYSGGAVLNASWEIMGIIQQDDGGHGAARRIDSVVEALRSCATPAYPVLLRVKHPVLIKSFAVADAAIAKGSSTMLHWITENAATCSITPTLGIVETSGSRSVAPTEDTTYQITCNGLGGSVSQKKLVSVLQPVEILSFKTSPLRIASGKTATLIWSTRNARNCSVDQGIGPVDLVGSVQVQPDSDTSYTLSCNGSRGPVARTADVAVAQPVKIELFDAGPKRIRSGSSATLRWRVANARSCSIDNEIGDVQVAGSKRVSPDSTTTYTLMCEGIGGPVTGDAEVQVTAPAGNQNPTVGQYCCDGFGVRRCMMPVAGPLRGPCFCFGQGNGMICQ